MYVWGVVYDTVDAVLPAWLAGGCLSALQVLAVTRISSRRQAFPCRKGRFADIGFTIHHTARQFVIWRRLMSVYSSVRS